MALERGVCFDARPHLFPLPLGEDISEHDFWLAEDCPANSVTRISANRRMFLLLLGEKDGMREDVAPSHDEIRRFIQGF